jgi:hypothetical protein
MVLALIKLIFIIKTQGAAYLGRGGAADGRRRLALAAGSVRKGRRCSGLEEVTVRDWGDAAQRGGALGLVGFDCGGSSGGIVWRQCSGHGRRRIAGDGALVVFRQRGGRRTSRSVSRTSWLPRRRPLVSHAANRRRPVRAWPTAVTCGSGDVALHRRGRRRGGSG